MFETGTDSGIAPDPWGQVADLAAGPGLAGCLDLLGGEAGGAAGGEAGGAPGARADGDGFGLVELVAGWERVASWVAARQLEVVQALHEHLREVTPQGVGVPDAGEVAAAELAARCRLSGFAAQSRVGLAWTLTQRLPATLVALREGRIDVAQARMIADRTCHLQDEDALLVEARVLERASGCSPSVLRRRVDRAVVEVDPQAVIRRRRRAQAERGVFHRPLPDGMAEVCVVTSAESATACMDHVVKTGRDRFSPADRRNADQRRADAAVALLLGGLPVSPPLPGDGNRTGADANDGDGEGASVQDAGDPAVLLPSGVPVRVNVTVPLSALLGVDTSAGMLDGYGPIPAGLARALATSPHATWRRLVTDPLTGGLLDVGRTTYRPPANLDRFVRHRDGMCRFPGCGHSARWADLDHTVRFPDGPTAASNLTALCRRHHRLKHQTGWDLRPGADGDAGAQTVWRSPTGHTYTTAPQPLDPSTHHPTRDLPDRHRGTSKVEKHLNQVLRV